MDAGVGQNDAADAGVDAAGDGPEAGTACGELPPLEVFACATYAGVEFTDELESVTVSGTVTEVAEAAENCLFGNYPAFLAGQMPVAGSGVKVTVEDGPDSISLIVRAPGFGLTSVSVGDPVVMTVQRSPTEHELEEELASYVRLEDSTGDLLIVANKRAPSGYAVARDEVECTSACSMAFTGSEVSYPGGAVKVPNASTVTVDGWTITNALTTDRVRPGSPNELCGEQARSLLVSLARTAGN